MFKKIQDYYENQHKTLILLVIISFLYTIPFIMSGEYYVDDMGRALHGYGWTHDARFLASMLMKVLSFGGQIVSPYPFSLFISALLWLCVGLIASSVLELEKNRKIKLTPLIFLLSPFAIENLYYRYDAIIMAVAMLCAVAPYVFINNSKKFFAISALCLYLAFGLFQTATMAYFSMLICYSFAVFINNGEKNKTAKTALIAIASFFSAFIAYRLSILMLGMEPPDRGRLILLEPNFVEIFSLRIIQFFLDTKATLAGSKYFYAATPFLVITIIGAASYLKKVGLKSKITTAAFISICLLFLLILMGMPNLVIAEPWWTARTFLGFPFLITFLFLLAQQSKYSRWTTAALIILLYYTFLLSAITSSALKNKAEYSDFIISNISQYILQPEIKFLLITGQIPQAPRNEQTYKKFPILHQLAPLYEVQNWGWGIRSMSRYRNLDWSENRDQLTKERCQIPVIYSNVILALRQQGETLIVDFDKTPCAPLLSKEK